MLKETLLTKDFYLDQMSMFMKDSYGMIDREETYRAILNNVNDVADGLISRYDIFNLLFTEDYFERNKPLGWTADAYKASTVDTVLDTIGAIFGIQRTFNIKYLGVNYNGHYGADTSTEYKETITLSNLELYIYIQVVITKLNYQGTTEEIKHLYYGNNQNNTYVQDLKIYYSWDDANPLDCNVFFCNSDEIAKNNYNSNIVKLFLSDKLLVESLGIRYLKHLTTATFVARFDDPSDISTYKYIFDPDFTKSNENTFAYGVFA